jgi:hypothetical protein
MGSSILSVLAPFEGAEDNQTLTTQESLRSFERSPERLHAFYKHLTPKRGEAKLSFRRPVSPESLHQPIPHCRRVPDPGKQRRHPLQRME